MPYKDPKKRREFQRKWRAANRDKLRKASLKGRTANKVRETNRVYREANREKVRGYQRKHQAEKRAMAKEGGDSDARDTRADHALQVGGRKTEPIGAR